MRLNRLLTTKGRVPSRPNRKGTWGLRAISMLLVVDDVQRILEQPCPIHRIPLSVSAGLGLAVRRRIPLRVAPAMYIIKKNFRDLTNGTNRFEIIIGGHNLVFDSDLDLNRAVFGSW